MAWSREPTSRMYAALENGIVVQVLAMVLAGGLRRATHGLENIKCAAKRQSAKSLSSALERSQSPSGLVSPASKSSEDTTQPPCGSMGESPDAANFADSWTIVEMTTTQPLNSYVYKSVPSFLVAVC